MKLSSPHTPYGPCLHLAQAKVSDIFFNHLGVPKTWLLS